MEGGSLSRAGRMTEGRRMLGQATATCILALRFSMARLEAASSWPEGRRVFAST
jgi:hypothetical protein